MEVEQFGGYVDPPTHLKKAAGKTGGGPLPPELRTVPDYDFSLFRYSSIAIPFLLLLIGTAVLLIGLTFWQGRWGFRRGPNGLEDAQPIDYAIKSAGREGGLRYPLRNLRIAMFCCGTVAIIIVVFAIAARLTPGPLKGLLLIAALILFALSVISWIAFAVGVHDVQFAWECANWAFTTTGLRNFAFGPSDICDDRRQLSTATVCMDAALATFSLLLCIALIFTTMKKNWAWGPGRLSIEKSANRPAINYPPPSPFTHVADTRRVYVYILLFFVGAFVLMDWILAIMLSYIRVQPNLIDNQGHTIIKSGWPVQKNRFRLAIAVITFGILIINLIDNLATKRRWIAYLMGALLFLCAGALFVVFAFDVHSINKAKNLACPDNIVFVKPGYGNVAAFNFQIVCVHWSYQATAFVDFALAFLLLLFVIFEYIFRSTRSWNTYYFFADSEWLRNHSIFVDATDREAYDWKRYTMETGRDYFYSPTLGISTRVRPRNYVDPDFIAPLF
jgi:hypothetical protein